jgi:hypothetical protein
MGNTNPVPTSLKVVACLFVLSGVVALAEVVASLAHGQLNLNLGVLGLLIGPGLLRLSRAWRTCALVYLWVAMVATPVAAIVLVSISGPLAVELFGQEIGYAWKGLGLTAAAVVFVLEVWQYRVLTRQDVRRLFGLPGS